MVMNGPVLIGTILILLLQFQQLDSRDETNADPCFKCRTCETAKTACGWERRKFVRDVSRRLEKSVDRRLTKKYEKRLNNLKDEFDRFRNQTKKALRRMKMQMSCPMGYVRYKKHCFQFVMSKTNWKKWEDARDFCQNANANLLYLNSTKKHNFIRKYLRENFEDHTSSVFTSGIFCDESFVPYRWDPGTQKGTMHSSWQWQGKKKPVGTDPTSLQWCQDTIPKKDQKLNNINSCLILSRTCEWEWSAGKCGEKRPFICEMALDPNDRICRNC